MVEIVGFNPNWVLNLIITGIPSIQLTLHLILQVKQLVLNLIITGIPSIQGLDRELASEIAKF